MRTWDRFIRFGVPAFSLVEVLIAVVVLSLGLLGLAAVFPAVLTQQRTASDGALGAALARAAQDYLNNGAMRARSPRYNGGGAPLDLTSAASERRGWDLLIADTNWSKDEEWTIPGADKPFVIDPATGTLTIGDSSTPPEQLVTISQADRLYPRPYASAGDTPRLVWDIAMRRRIGGAFSRELTGAGSGTGRTPSALDSVQVAVFVRRVDSGIRAIGGNTLADVLSGQNLPNAQDQRVAVAQDRDGRPLNDGVGSGGSGSRNYSTAQKIGYTLGTPTSEGYPLIQFDADPLSDYAQQVGQRMVDQFGVVHTVTALDTDPAAASVQVRGVFLSPPLAADIKFLEGTSEGLVMLFTPQVPVDVEVFDVYK